MKSTAEELEQVALFEEFLERKLHLGTVLHPKLRITSYPYHQSANGQAELTNKVIIQNLKKGWKQQMANGRKNYPEIYGPTKQRQIEHMRNSFSLVYGVEALIPLEVGEPTLRYSQTNGESSDEAMLINLELLEERMDLTQCLNEHEMSSSRAL
ncbi:uncharacterized protein LOC142178378 [Nicotiana tabacum]|uniref:Uncharacterized protein LOC142178378 n=1 Tax=Nicotiana tabacum TaxID=4097 RepID=A0AC58U2W2_TOBAC